MPRKRYSPEEIIHKLREAEVLLSQGHTVQEAARQLGIAEQTYYRWRKEYGGMDKSQEIQADAWAARYLKRGRDRSDKWPYWETTRVALLILFGAMDLLRDKGFLKQVERETLAERLATLLFSSENPNWPQPRLTAVGYELLSMAGEILWGGG